MDCDKPLRLQIRIQKDYQTDTFYSGGVVFSDIGATRTGTTDPTLYQTERYDNNFSYNIPLANGTYTVTLKFAEIYCNQAGQRIFDVFVQGVPVISNLDVFASAGGKDKAYDVPINVSVTDSMLNIRFTAVTDNATVSAIEVAAQFRLLSGASGFVESGGTIVTKTGNFQIIASGQGLYKIDPLCPDGTKNCFTNGQLPVACTCTSAEPLGNGVSVCAITPVIAAGGNYQQVSLSQIADSPLRFFTLDAPFQFTCAQ